MLPILNQNWITYSQLVNWLFSVVWGSISCSFHASNFPRYSKSMSGLVAFMAPSLLLTNFIHSLKWQESASYSKTENTIMFLTNSRGEGSFWSGVAGRWGYRGRGVEIMQPAFARTPKHSTALIRLHLYTACQLNLFWVMFSKVKVCNTALRTCREHGWR